MADQPIIRINIDAEQFDDFRQKFAEYQAEVRAQPEAWKGSNEAVKILSSRFEDAADSFDRLNKTATNPKFAGESGVFTKFQKSSLETGKSWTLITKEIAKSEKALGGLAREMLGIGKLGGGVAASAIGGAAALYAGTRKAAFSLAADNAENKQLNLKPGVARAYDIAYRRFGASQDQLGTFATAKDTPTYWAALQAVGIQPDEIKGDDAEQLARTYLQKLGEKWRSIPEGPARGSWLTGSGQDKLGMTVESANQAAAYYPPDWDHADARFPAIRDRLALSQAKYAKGTDAQQDYEVSEAEVETALKGALVELAPIVTTLTKKFADAISAFSKSKDLDGYIKDLTDDFKKLDAALAWVGKLADKVSPQLPSFGNAGDALDDAGINAGHVAYDMGRLVADDQFQSNLKNFLHGHWEKISKNAVSVDGAGTGANGEAFTMPGTFVRDPNRKADIKALEIANGMPPGYLAAEEQIESSGGKNNVNPNNPNVLGAMQFDQPTAEKYGVNRYDERSSLEGAAKKLRDLYSKYGDWGKTSASFDGFAGLDRDIAEHGDRWRDYIGDYQKSGETTAYLNRLEAQGVDLNGDGGNAHTSAGTVAQQLARRFGTAQQNAGAGDGTDSTPNMPPILSRPAGMGALPAQQINVNVSAPPGSSVSVTTAGFPH